MSFLPIKGWNNEDKIKVKSWNNLSWVEINRFSRKFSFSAFCITKQFVKFEITTRNNSVKTRKRELETAPFSWMQLPLRFSTKYDKLKIHWDNLIVIIVATAHGASLINNVVEWVLSFAYLKCRDLNFLEVCWKIQSKWPHEMQLLRRHICKLYSAIERCVSLLLQRVCHCV